MCEYMYAETAHAHKAVILGRFVEKATLVPDVSIEGPTKQPASKHTSRRQRYIRPHSTRGGGCTRASSVLVKAANGCAEVVDTPQ